MSNNLLSFGELSLRSATPETTENENGFSSIDLDGAQTPKTSDSMEINEIMKSHDDNNNNSSLTKNGSSYTSFGEALSPKKTPPVKPNIVSLTAQNSSPKKMLSSDSVSSYDFVHINSNPNFDSGNSVSPTSMLSSASDVSSKLASKTASTLESFKLWGKSAYKCTKQIVSEKLGKSSRTIDPELDVAIDNLKETKKKYEIILAFSRNLSIHFSNIMQTQKYLSDTFSDLAQKSPELITEFTTNAETQRHLIRHGEHLLSKNSYKKQKNKFNSYIIDIIDVIVDAINHFSNSLTTLCEKTMEDTFITIRNYEAARLEYDAYRFDLEALKSLPDSKPNDLASLEHDVSIYKERYENLKKDVQIKIRFLDENRIKVMRKQLNQFQFAISIYFSGNNELLEKTMKEFRENGVNNVSSSPESFLEHQ